MSGELRSWEDVKNDLLKNPETASAYNDLEGEYRLISAIIQSRLEK